MLCVVGICCSSCTSVSFSKVEERSVDLRHMAAVATQREPTCDVRRPNISGEIVSANANQVSENGPFFLEDAINGPSGGDTSNNLMVCIDASRTNSCYGAATTVQPASVRVLACVKI
jgi:hypothetical protein